MKNAREHFKTNDPVLYECLCKVGKLEEIKKDKPQKYFYRLCYEIVGQQLSDKSSSAIFKRFEKLFPKGVIEPKDILRFPHEKLRATGMSHAKARYIRNLAEHMAQNRLHVLQFDVMSNQEVMSELTQVKGIGPWTAEMFLMFTLGREDVFSHGDLGLRKAIKKLYGFKKEPSRKQIEKIVIKWSPYKTYASRVLWASLEL